LSSIKGLDKNYSGLFEERVDTEGIERIGDRSIDKGFMERFGWIYQSTLIAEHLRIKLNKVYEISTIEALNCLSYIVAKNNFDLEQKKKVYGKYS